MNLSLSDDPPFLGVDAAIWAAAIGGVATILAAALGAWMVAWQIGRQARHAIAQNRDNERLKLKLRVYEDILAACTRATDANIAASNYARVFLSVMPALRWRKEQGLPIVPPLARWPELSKLGAAAKSAAIEFVCFVERWTVIDPRLEVFKFAFNAALFDLERTWTPYSDLAMRLMPVEIPNTGQLAPWDLPSVEVQQRLVELTSAVCEEFETLTAYTSDLQVEAQNLLLIELFGNRAPTRKALDPRFKVITLDAAEDLRAYFEHETPWGESVRRTIARVADEIANRPR